MESAFQFTDPSLTKLEFHINEKYKELDNIEVKLLIKLSVSVEKMD